jgi:hypothetical protein
LRNWMFIQFLLIFLCSPIFLLSVANGLSKTQSWLGSSSAKKSSIVFHHLRKNFNSLECILLFNVWSTNQQHCKILSPTLDWQHQSLHLTNNPRWPAGTFKGEKHLSSSVSFFACNTGEIPLSSQC